MAARKIRTTLSDEWKTRISATKIMQRLMKHHLGEIEMTRTQIEAAKLILAKVVPDLARTEFIGDRNNPIKHVFSWESPESKK